MMELTDADHLAFIQTTILVFSPLVVGLLLAWFVKIPLKYFQIVYLLLGLAWLLIHWFYFPGVNILLPLAMLAVGEVAHLLFIGLTGSHSLNSHALLAGVGLFPWYSGLGLSAVYLGLSLLLVALLMWVKFKWGERAIGRRFQNEASARNNLSEEDFAKFKRKAGLNFAGPMLIALVVAVLSTF